MKRLISILLAVLLLICSGCAPDDSNTGASSDAASGNSQSSASKTDASDEGGASDELITVRVGWSRGATITYPEGDNMENNAWTRAYENAGYKLDFTLVTVPEQYPQKLALAIASNDLPDIWMSDKKNFYLAQEGGYCLDLTDLFEENLTDLSKQYLGEYDLPFQAATIDDRLMAFPELNEDPTTDAQLTFIRHDWLEALGLPVPTTQQEMVDTLIAFAKEDPDGNGQADTFGLGIKKELWTVNYGLEGFFNAYHAYPNIWYENGGKLVYGTVQAEAMKAALTDLQRLYQEGAIDKEFIVKDSDKVQEDVISMKIGAMYGRWWTFGGAPTKMFMADDEKQTDRYWCIESVTNDGSSVNLQSSSSAPNNFMICNKDFAHPEALFDFVNIWFENMFKPDLTEEEYMRYAVDENCTPQSFAFQPGLWPYINPRVENIRGVNDGSIDPETLTGESKQIYNNIKAFEEGDYYAVAYDHYWNHSFLPHSSMDIRWKYFDNDTMINDMYYGPTTDTMLEKMSTLEKLRDETIVQIITGEKNVDDFDKFVEDWYKLGGEDIVNEMNDWYASQK